MKKKYTLIGISAIGVFVLFFISCRKQINSSVSSSNKLSAKAVASTTNEKILTDIAVFIPCANGGAGETVELSGFLHETTHLTITGNNFHVKDHFQPQGISGVGQTTGDKYQATGVTQDEFGGSFVNGQYEETYVDNFRIIGQGPGNNYLIHENLHITINANGTVTTFVDNVTSDCK